ncbi:hypothetical protein B0H34DRAFT_118514 [Crassisporium funariophilum]|nr:hypothetical protein B0H34DRAFT_118514 [Crassisporium funariophilum]
MFIYASYLSRLLVNDLRSIIASRPNPYQHGLGPSMTGSTLVPPSMHQGNGDADGILPATVPPPPLTKADYMDVPFWERRKWTAHVKSESERSRNVPKLGFLTDAEGEPVAKDRLTAMFATARSLFVEIFRARCDPDGWHTVGKIASTYFNNSLAAEYPEFQMGDSLWKCDAFGVNQYPMWKRDHRDKGKITRHRPSIRSTKRKLDTGSDLRSKAQQKAKKKPRIDSDLDLDITDTPPSHTVPKHSKSATNKSSAKFMSYGPQAERSTSVESIEFIGTGPATHVQSSSSDNLDSSSAFATVAPSTGTTSREKTPGPEPTDSDQPLTADTPSLPPSAPAIDPPGGKDQPPSAEAVANSKKKPAAVKAIQPTKAITVRNLFMADYIKENGPVTAAEFKIALDSQDAASRKRYDDLCRCLKTEEKSKKATGSAATSGSATVARPSSDAEHEPPTSAS